MSQHALNNTVSFLNGMLYVTWIHIKDLTGTKNGCQSSQLTTSTLKSVITSDWCDQRKRLRFHPSHHQSGLKKTNIKSFQFLLLGEF